MRASQKLRAFSMPILMGAVATGGGMAWEAMAASHPILLIPVAVATISCAVIGTVSLMVKSFMLAEDGWEKIAGECRGCRRLKKENNELLEAIK
jgi:hypothetical protein